MEEVRRLRKEVKAGQEETSRSIEQGAAERRATLSRGKPTRSSTVLMKTQRISWMRQSRAAVAKTKPTEEGRTKEALEKIKPEALTEGRHQSNRQQAKAAQTGRPVRIRMVGC